MSDVISHIGKKPSSSPSRVVFVQGLIVRCALLKNRSKRFGAPVYVRHEIVHNKHVVDRLAAMGAVFVEELCDIPDGKPVVFSAHGVAKSVVAEAARAI